MILDYVLVDLGDNLPKDADLHMAEFLRKGYVPQGGPFYDPPTERVYQAVVKYEK